ncbi:MAG: AAA family ATPase, partial [Myxococcota bacterium]
PGNILITSDGEGGAKLKLSDFGLVHRSTQDLLAPTTGAPMYMAPEQLRGGWRQFGPWTDLYALGCVAYEQCCGRLPFRGQTLYELAYQKMSKDPPALTPRMAIPRGFEKWVLRLLSKDAYERFRCAADAAWALIQLGDPSAQSASFIAADASSPEVKTRRDTLGDAPWTLESDPAHLAENTLYTHLTMATTPFGLGSQQVHAGALSEISRDLPPLPQTWQSATPSAASTRLVGAGLGLFALRETPFVGRSHARDVLWDQLRASHAERRPHAAVVRGGSGVGKSRLGSWLVEHAHEVGGADVLRAVHQAEAGGRGGLVRMVKRYFSASGLTRAKSYEQVLTQLEVFAQPKDNIQKDALAIVELMFPGDSEEIPGVDAQERVGVLTSAERLEVLATLLDYISRERPIILWMDDAHCSPEALTFTRMILEDERAAELPVFVLLGVHQGASGASSMQDLEAICGSERTQTITLGPMDRQEHERLRDLLLPLEPELFDHLYQLTQGNPMFTVQLVRGWVERDALEVGRGGWTPRAGVELFSSASIDQLWDQRLDHLSWSMREELHPLQTRIALELAAVLGLEVELDLWREGCQDLSFKLPEQLPLELAARAVMRFDGERARFVHDDVRRVLLERAEEAGRLTMHHECAAHVLQHRLKSGIGDTEGLSRVVAHLVRAGAVSRAIESLTKLARLSQCRGAFGVASGHLDALQELLLKHELHERDADWILLDELRAISQWASMGVAPALKIIDHALERAVDTQDTALLARLHLTRARLLWEAGRREECIASCHTSSDAFAEVGDGLGVAKTLALYTRLHLSRRRLKLAAEYAFTGVELCQSLEGEVPLGEVYGARAHLDLAIAQIHAERERFDQATVVLERAQRMFREIGDRLHAGVVRFEFGRLAHQRRSMKAAERFYLDAIAELEGVDHVVHALPKLHYGIMLLELGDVASARGLLVEAVELLRAHGHNSTLTLGYLATAAVWASSEDAVRWGRDFELALRYVERSCVPGPELAVCAELGADALARAGQWASAARAHESAAGFWRLGG